MRRALILTNDSAGHRFRAAFVYSEPLDRDLPPVADALLAEPAPRSRLREDVSFFLLSYVSGLIIFFGMIG